MSRPLRAEERVILVAHPGAELYGSDRVMLETVEALREDGRRVVVALPVDGPLVAQLQKLGADVRICRMPVTRKSALRPRGFVRYLGDTAAGIRDGRRVIKEVRPELIYVSTLTIPLWFVLARAARIPSICHVHEAERSSSRLVRTALALPLLLADKVVANSRFSVDVLASAFSRLGSTEVLYNGVTGPRSRRPARLDLAGRLGVVYVGRLSPRKGVDVAVSAVESLRAEGRDVSLDLVGSVFPGYEWYESELRGQVDRAGLGASIRFHGFKNKVWDEIADSDVLVVPSRVDEPFGNTAVEGILSGRPVVASATSGLLEAVADYPSTRTVAPGDPRALADALRDVADGWQERRENAWTDAGEAERRHSTSRYRDRIRAIVHDLEAA